MKFVSDRRELESLISLSELFLEVDGASSVVEVKVSKINAIALLLSTGLYF